MSNDDLDFDALLKRSRKINRFPARYSGTCAGCGEDFSEDDDVGFVDYELCCESCCDIEDGQHGL